MVYKDNYFLSFLYFVIYFKSLQCLHRFFIFHYFFSQFLQFNRIDKVGWINLVHFSISLGNFIEMQTVLYNIFTSLGLLYYTECISKQIEHILWTISKTVCNSLAVVKCRVQYGKYFVTINFLIIMLFHQTLRK